MSLLSGTPKELVLSLINSNNELPVPVTGENLYFGKPRMDADGLTTILPTVSVLGEQYEGYVDFRYNRIDLSKAYDERPVLRAVGEATIYRMLPVINRALGLTLTEDDVLDADVALVEGGEEVNINVVTKATSLGYRGSFLIRFRRLRPLLNTIVLNKQLDELHQPGDPSLQKVCLPMAMYNIDFTADRAVLATTWNQYWFDIAGVQKLAAENGFPNWPPPEPNGVTTYVARNHPLANPKFDRVAVQKNVVGPTYAGDAFFHYNLS